MKKLLRIKWIFLFVINFLFESNVAFSQNYCIPVYTVGTAGDSGNYLNNDYIQFVSLVGNQPPGIMNSLNLTGPNISPWNGGAAPFTAHPLDYENMIPNSVHPNVACVLTAAIPNIYYTLSYQTGNYPTNSYLAGFIDFNHDGDFNDTISGISEKVFQSGAMSWNQFNTTTITVPASAFIGCTRFRVREARGVPNIDPCATYTYGETEDYQVCVIGNSVGIDESNQNGFSFLSIDNTANNSIDLVFYSDRTEPIKYSIIDISGREVLSGLNPKVNNGINRIPLDHDFVNGIYFVTLQNKSGTLTKKVFRN